MNVVNFNCIYFYNHPIGKIIEKQHLIAVYVIKKHKRTKQRKIFRLKNCPHNTLFFCSKFLTLYDNSSFK